MENPICPDDGSRTNIFQQKYNNRYYVIYECPACGRRLFHGHLRQVSDSPWPNIPEILNIDEMTMKGLEKLHQFDDDRDW